jgi:hypothetical protein
MAKMLEIMIASGVDMEQVRSNLKRSGIGGANDMDLDGAMKHAKEKVADEY